MSKKIIFTQDIDSAPVAIAKITVVTAPTATHTAYPAPSGTSRSANESPLFFKQKTSGLTPILVLPLVFITHTFSIRNSAFLAPAIQLSESFGILFRCSSNHLLLVNTSNLWYSFKNPGSHLEILKTLYERCQKLMRQVFGQTKGKHTREPRQRAVARSASTTTGLVTTVKINRSAFHRVMWR